MSSRLSAAALIVAFFVNTAFAAPEATRFVVVSAENFAHDAQQALLAVDLSGIKSWPSLILSFVKGHKARARIDGIEIKPGDITLMQGEEVDFTAIAVGGEQTVGGVMFRWTVMNADGSSQPRRLNNGHFKATRPGEYIVTASAEGRQAQTTITVRRNDGYGISRILRKRDSERTEEERRQVAQWRASGALTTREISSRNVYSEAEQQAMARKDRKERLDPQQKQTAQRKLAEQAIADNTDQQGVEQGSRRGGPNADANVSETSAPASPFFFQVDPLGWDSGNWSTADDPGNSVGHPAGSAPDAGAANGNFTLSTPAVSLPGRGIDINLNLTYNSRLWSKSGTEMTYNPDAGYPAPGWSLGFGRCSIWAAAEAACWLHRTERDVHMPVPTRR
ncbi:MAG: hypothetical protein WBD22_06115 [Pyrinomonadaceae bacterium]